MADGVGRWAQQNLSDVDYVYWWADGIWFNVRVPDRDGNQDWLCALVIVGVRPDGTKGLVAVTDGYGNRPSRAFLDRSLS